MLTPVGLETRVMLSAEHDVVTLMLVPTETLVPVVTVLTEGVAVAETPLVEVHVAKAGSGMAVTNTIAKIANIKYLFLTFMLINFIFAHQ